MYKHIQIANGNSKSRTKNPKLYKKIKERITEFRVRSVCLFLMINNMNMLIDKSNRDWVEDFSHENGNYMCKCGKCKNYFYGHKRRVRCKLCSF